MLVKNPTNVILNPTKSYQAMVTYLILLHKNDRNINCFLRVIPTLKHYSDIVSDIPSRSTICSIWHIYSDILSDILSGILSGLYSDILSGIFSGIHSVILSGILSGTLSIWHLFCDILSGILSDILSGVWLRSSSAH